MSVRALRRGSIAASRVAGAPAGTNVLTFPGTTGNKLTTPDAAANSITGDIDIRAKLSLVDWTPAGTATIVAKWAGGGTRSYQFTVNTDSTPSLAISKDGSDFYFWTGAAFSFTDGSVQSIRFTRTASTGVVRFYTSSDFGPGVPGTWTQHGSNVSGTSGNIFNSAQGVEVGDSTWTEGAMAGNLYYLELRDGIDGTVTQSFDATAVTKLGTRNPTTVAAGGSGGGTWTMNGSAWDWSSV